MFAKTSPFASPRLHLPDVLCVDMQPAVIDLTQMTQTTQTTQATRVGGSLLRPLRDFASQATRLPDRLSRVVMKDEDPHDELYLQRLGEVGVHAVAAYEVAVRIQSSPEIARDPDEWVQLCDQLQQESDSCREALDWFLSVLDTQRRIELLRLELERLESVRDELRGRKLPKRERRERREQAKQQVKETQAALAAAQRRREMLAHELTENQRESLGSSAERLLAAELTELAERSDALAEAVRRTNPWETNLLSPARLLPEVEPVLSRQSEREAAAKAEPVRTSPVRQWLTRHLTE